MKARTIKPNWRPVPVTDLARLIEARDATQVAARDDPRLAPFAEAASLALAQARHARASAFGARYGWKPSAAAFGVEDICAPVLLGRRWFRPTPGACRRKSAEWMSRGSITGRISAAGTSLRRLSPSPTRRRSRLETAQALARASGLKVRIEDDIESWWNSKCVVVVWTKARW
jgi:hypothetical protein